MYWKYWWKGNLSNETISHVCNSCRSSSFTMYIVLFAVFLTMSIGSGTAFIYFHWYTKNESITDINPSTETVIYRVQFHWTYKLEISNK